MAGNQFMKRSWGFTLSGFNIQFFHLLARSGCAPQEFQAGFDARFIVETADWDALRQFLPTVFFYQAGEDCFEGKAVQGVVGLEVRHEQPVFLMQTSVSSGLAEIFQQTTRSGAMHPTYQPVTSR
jgi:hypothetical protein